jgi:methionyl-tRNA formyltransferase
MLRKEDGEVDWDRPAHLVSCHIRAMDPWPGATTTLGGEALKLFQPRVIAGDGRPGEVLGSDERGLRVACGDGAVAIGEIQAAGRKRLPARAFLSGRSVPAGTALGGRA